MSKDIKNDNIQKDSRSDKLKLFSIGSVVIFALIIVFGNFLFDKLLGNALTFDFSDTNSHTVSKLTEDYLKGLPQDTHIRVVGLFNRPENVTGTYYQYIIPILDDYAKKSDGKVTVEYVDPTEQPSIITSLDPDNAYDLSSNSGNIVVEYNGRIKIITPLDCYSYDQSKYYSTGIYYITGNNTEYTFTNTMNSLTQGYNGKAYIVTGIKEAGCVNIKKILESMSIDVEGITVSDNFAVPSDCDLLILNGPNTDISEKMLVSITDYINNGGKVFIAVDYSSENVTENFDRLNRLLNQVDINIDPLLIYENDPGYQRGGYAIDSVVVATGDFANYVSVPYLHSTYARSVRKVDNPDSVISVVPVLATSDSASTLELDADGNPKADGAPVVGKFYVAYYAAVPSGAEVFVFGTLDFSSDSYIDDYSLNDSNVDFFKACVRELVDAKTGTQIDVETKTVDNFSLDTTKVTSTNATIMMIIFMIVIPVVLVAMAVIIYTKRKNL
jgi:hypothetical protein